MCAGLTPFLLLLILRLLVVSTCVGGIPEVLPAEFIRLAPTKASDLAVCLAEAIEEVIRARQRTDNTASPVGGDKVCIHTHTHVYYC